MSDFWRFATEYPGHAFFIIALALYAATRPFRYAMIAYRRRLRHLDIQAHGWPMTPMDADGDIIHPEPAHDR